MVARDAPDYRVASAYTLIAHLHRRTAARIDALAKSDGEEIAAMDGVLADARETISGLQRYQNSSFRRFAPEPPTAWSDGTFRLLDFGGSGQPVLVVPSLVNRWTILDLVPSRSPLRWLARNGFRVFLADWGSPTGEELEFWLEGYLENRLWPALSAAARLGGGPVDVVGYCMGGPLALATAAHRHHEVRRVVTMGAPWDFTAFPEHEVLKRTREHVQRTLTTMGGAFGVVPPQVTQTFFAMRNLDSGIEKFRQFASADINSDDARRFIAVEDWLNEGAPLSVAVAQECFISWMMEDALRQGGWIVCGDPFQAKTVRQSTLVIAATRDSVVRSASAVPLFDALSNARLLEPAAGHIGMVVGKRAIEDVWTPIKDFLTE